MLLFVYRFKCAYINFYRLFRFIFNLTAFNHTVSTTVHLYVYTIPSDATSLYTNVRLWNNFPTRFDILVQYSVITRISFNSFQPCRNGYFFIPRRQIKYHCKYIHINNFHCSIISLFVSHLTPLDHTISKAVILIYTTWIHATSSYTGL